jgi:hypothetical protein
LDEICQRVHLRSDSPERRSPFALLNTAEQLDKFRRVEFVGMRYGSYGAIGL